MFQTITVPSSSESYPVRTHYLTLKMKTLWSSEMSGLFIWQSKIQSDLNLQRYYCENLKYCMSCYLAGTDIRSSDNPNTDFFIQLYIYITHWNDAPNKLHLKLVHFFFWEFFCLNAQNKHLQEFKFCWKLSKMPYLGVRIVKF